MIDIEGIRSDFDGVRANLARRKDPAVLDRLDEARAADAAWRTAQQEIGELRRRRNELTREVGAARSAGADATRPLAEATVLAGELANAEAAEKTLAARRDDLLRRLPNLLDPSVPYGVGGAENEVVRAWGAPAPSLPWLRSHGELLESLGMADFTRAQRASGAGFYYLKGDVVRLELALERYALEQLVAAGFTPVLPPHMLRRAAYEGVTDLADFETVMYKIEGEDLYLIATSEHPIAAMFLGEILDEGSLPIRLAGLSPCYRKEIGGHGVDQKGVFRVHQFQKIEQFVFCRPEDSPARHEELLGHAERVFQGLGLAYRVVNICTGDIGTVAAKKYDIEAWFPRQQQYREVVSCSNCTDYQSRRLGIRMGTAGKPGKRVPHTLNSTAIATSRAVAAILEVYQDEDGSVRVPEVLVPYLGGTTRLVPPTAPAVRSGGAR